MTPFMNDQKRSFLFKPHQSTQQAFENDWGRTTRRLINVDCFNAFSILLRRFYSVSRGWAGGGGGRDKTRCYTNHST